MFWFNAPIFFISIFMLNMFSLQGCSWQPLYQKNAIGLEIAAQLSNIKVKAPSSNAGRQLQTQIEAAFAPKTDVEKKMQLIISLSIKEQNLLVRSDDKATRRNFIASAAFRLIAQKNDKAKTQKLFSDKVSAITSYNRTSSEFANQIARRDAQRRVLDQLALTIKKRIIVFFHTQQKDKEKKDKENGQDQTL